MKKIAANNNYRLIKRAEDDFKWGGPATATEEWETNRGPGDFVYQNLRDQQNEHFKMGDPVAAMGDGEGNGSAMTMTWQGAKWTMTFTKG
jgi:hypothetical protein